MAGLVLIATVLVAQCTPAIGKPARNGGENAAPSEAVQDGDR